MTQMNSPWEKPHIEVADILREHISDFKAKYRMPPEHYKMVCDILNCRTSYLGGHIEECDHCDHQRNAYNSCRNRHYPKCQALTKERWLEARKAELLPVVYFHLVFTLPHVLNPVILCNKKVMLKILFTSVSETLIEFGANNLGGKLAMISILHTWDQLLNDHFHLHCLVPGGVLSDDKCTWIDCENNYLFPNQALSIVFRGKFLAYMKKAYENGHLIFPGNTEPLGTLSGFRQLIDKCYKTGWVVYVKPSIKDPEYVLEYLGRYTHRVAISNNRILALENGQVTFAYKNRKTGETEKITIGAVEFIRRFLLHVLPRGFMRIRHFGLFANRYKKDNLMFCRKCLGLSADLPEVVQKSVQEMMEKLTGENIMKCPFCGKGTMHVVDDLPGHKGPSGFEILHPIGTCI
jgi:hypothetical protein